jgi:hypothetical protein
VNNLIVSLNRIVATAGVEGPKAALDALDVLAADARLNGHYRLDAVPRPPARKGRRSGGGGCVLSESRRPHFERA